MRFLNTTSSKENIYALSQKEIYDLKLIVVQAVLNLYKGNFI